MLDLRTHKDVTIMGRHDDTSGSQALLTVSSCLEGWGLRAPFKSQLWPIYIVEAWYSMWEVDPVYFLIWVPQDRSLLWMVDVVEELKEEGFKDIRVRELMSGEWMMEDELNEKAAR